MTKMRVQKNVPMPQRVKNGAKYPWREMKVGDSFLFPEATGRASYAAAYSASKSGDKKFRVMKTDEGWRCWRMK